ncbi:MAG: phage tail protein [Polaromonas sp.]
MGISNRSGGTPTGHCANFPATVAPAGYIKRNGALLSRTTYAALWAYAQASGNLAANDGAWQAGMFSPGDGATTFRIPDGRGEFERGFDDGRGIDAGRAIGQAQAGQNASHGHNIGIKYSPASVNSSNVTYDGGGDMAQTNSSAGWVSGRDMTYTTQSVGGSEARPRNVAVLACIKY